ncbi:MAG TPA: lipopolysaccharide assembly protein LapA domain-containing protein [Streptosporangiaceae bacterium]|jgi:uncharacterized integral membrane protein
MTSEPPQDIPPGADTATGPADQGTAPPARPARGVKRTRAGGVWVAVALFALVLILLLIFILENTQRVDISYFGVHGHSTLGIAILLAAVLGALLVAIPATWRIVQLRIAARRRRHASGE